MKASDIEEILVVKPGVVSLGTLLARVAGPGRTMRQDLPASPGIYAVCLPAWETRLFMAEAGKARHANPLDPRELDDKREQILAGSPTDIVYIGRTSNLRKRVGQLVRFGMGQARNHRGGEWLWQLERIHEAQLWMWCCSGDEPELLKHKLLEAFRADHGDRPLANRI